jgi:hypothetical protein
LVPSLAVVASEILNGFDSTNNLLTAQSSAPMEHSYERDPADFDRNVIDGSSFDFFGWTKGR